MGHLLLSTHVFLLKWLVPLLFAIGLIFFVYGFIVYYIIGHKSGDEDRMEHGRHNLLKAFVFLSVALLIYLVVFLIGWVGMELTSNNGNINGEGSADGNTRIERDSDILKVPDVPRRNQ